MGFFVQRHAQDHFLAAAPNGDGDRITGVAKLIEVAGSDSRNEEPVAAEETSAPEAADIPENNAGAENTNE